MATAARVLGGLGFIFSAITDMLVLSIFLSYLAMITYPISILLRGVACILLSGSLKNRFYAAVGILVMFLGALFFLTLLGGGDLLEAGPSELFIPVVIWAVYSLIEFSAYLRLRIYSKVFLGAMISIVGIAVLLLGVILPATSDEMYQYLQAGLVPLIISALMASIGFFSLRIRGDEGIVM